mgnify:CR=1 FL=1
MRTMTFKRRRAYALARPLVVVIIRFIWLTCRVKTVIGEENAEKALATGKPFIPCYWHQQHIFCAWYLFKLQKRGLKLGFLISPSVDGEIPAKIVQSLGAVAIRGSSTRTGAKAIRDLYEVMAKQGVSPVNTADGPTGPIYKFKPGAVMLAQLTQYPMLPLAFVAERCWYLRSWDRFAIPKPFSKVVVAIGELRYVDKATTMPLQPAIAKEIDYNLNAMMEVARKELSQ